MPTKEEIEKMRIEIKKRNQKECSKAYKILNCYIQSRGKDKDIDLLNVIIEQTEILNESMYDTRIQRVICMEEMAELQKEISKNLRGKQNREELIKEMADVYICLENLKHIFEVDDEEFENKIREKVDRNAENAYKQWIMSNLNV